MNLRYMQLPCADPEQFPEGVSAPSLLRLYNWSRKTGPLDDAGKRQLFQDWLTLRLRRLYGGMTPTEVPHLDFEALLDIDPAQGPLAILLERRRSGPRVYLQLEARKCARLLRCTHGSWSVSGEVRPPKVLRVRRRPKPTRRLLSAPLARA